MRVLVTGATGFIGRAVVARLRARGDQIVPISRAAPDAATWKDVDREMALADAVVHLAGESIAAQRWTPKRLAQVGASRVETTHRIAHAIECAPARPRVLVSASAVGIYGMRSGDRPLTESAPTASDALAQICVDWEAATLPARAAGARVVLARFGVVLGSDGGALPKMIAPFRFFAGGPIGDGRQVLSWIHVRDAARAILFSIDRSELSGPLNVVAPEPATMNNFAQALGRVLERPSFLRVPGALLRIAMGSGLATMVLTGQRAVPEKLLASGFAFDFPHLEGALAEIVAGGATD